MDLSLTARLPLQYAPCAHVIEFRCVSSHGGKIEDNDTGLGLQGQIKACLCDQPHSENKVETKGKHYQVLWLSRVLLFRA